MVTRTRKTINTESSQEIQEDSGEIISKEEIENQEEIIPVIDENSFCSYEEPEENIEAILTLDEWTKREIKKFPSEEYIYFAFKNDAAGTGVFYQTNSGWNALLNAWKIKPL